MLVHRVRHHVPRLPVGTLGRMRLDAGWLAGTLLRSARTGPRPDILLGVAPPFLVSALLLTLGRRLDVPTVCHVQDLQIDTAAGLGMMPAWLTHGLFTIERNLLGRMDLVTTCGEGMLRRIAAKGPLRHPPRLWPNWADCSAMHPVDVAAEPAPPVLRCLYSGSLGAKQGIELVVEAARLLRHRNDLHFTIAGEGLSLDRLRGLAADLPNIAFTGLVPANRLRDQLAGAHIHLIPQRSDAADLVLPSKLLNIMAVGRPVVVTAGPDTELHRIVTGAGAGLAVRPDDAGALADAIRHMADDAQLRIGAGLRGRAWVKLHRSSSTVLAGIEADLVETIRSHSERRGLNRSS